MGAFALTGAPAAAEGPETNRYTSAEAAMGKAVFARNCASCHGIGLANGSAVALKGDTFDAHWLAADKTLDEQRMVWQWYVKSRKAEDYKQMVKDSLYHPPHILINTTKTDESNLWLEHTFEDKPLVREFINNTMLVQIALLAWIFLGEAPGPLGLLGIATLSTGVYLVQARRGPGTSVRTTEGPGEIEPGRFPD